MTSAKRACATASAKKASPFDPLWSRVPSEGSDDIALVVVGR
ncbi:hypothetical protein [Streptomyces sp. KR80]